MFHGLIRCVCKCLHNSVVKPKNRVMVMTWSFWLQTLKQYIRKLNIAVKQFAGKVFLEISQFASCEVASSPIPDLIFILMPVNTVLP